LLFGNPGRSYYATELISLAGVGSGAVQRELGRLVGSGLVTVQTVGKQKHYRANKQSPLFTELCGIIEKTVGIAEPLREALRPLVADIRAAFVYGSMARKQDTSSSDIDLMILSDRVSYADCYSVVESAGTRLCRPVNPTIYSTKEFAKRLKNDSPFLQKVLSQPKIWLIGGEDDIRV
jgi:predicted nucleotidyltransferase